MKPVFNQCCCCFTLETGGQIIGWIYSVVGLLAGLGCIGLAVIIGINTETDFQDVKNFLIIIFVILACFALINFIAGILLISGVRQRNHKKMILILVLMVLGIISSFTNFIYSAEPTDIVSVTIGVIFQIYFFLCILSLYNKVKKEGTVMQKEQQAV